MLPFLKRKQDGSASAPIESLEMQTMPEGDEPEYDGLESAMEELCKAIEAKDYKAAAIAFRAAFELLEQDEPEEAPIESEE